MSQEDETHWREAERQFPNWPIFQRLELTEEQLQAHKEVQKEVGEFINGLVSDADEFEATTKDGIMTFSATFNLQEEKKQKC